MVHNATGLHARPAKVLVECAKQFRSDIQIRYGDKTANAKSILKILTLGVRCGATIQVQINGEDEEAAVQAIQEIVNSGLGEEEHTNLPEPRPATAD